MTRDVHITVTGAQLEKDGYRTVTELKAQGQYFEKDGSRYLMYEERDADTGAVTKSTLKIRDCLLELSKSGTVRSRMLFEPGKTHRTSYVTPYGTLLLEVCTEDIKSLWTESSGAIQITYSLSSEDALLSRNRLSVKIRNFSGSL